MKRRGFARAAATTLIAVPLALRSQPAAAPTRIGFISSLAAVPEPSTLRAFRQGLHELGYVEGTQVVIEARFAAGSPDRYTELIAELLRLKVKLIVVGSTPAALALKQTETTIPVVFAGLNDPVASGIVVSLARPQGRFTGVTMGVGGVGFAGKWVELLKEAAPELASAAVLSNSSNVGNVPFVPEVEAAARRMKLKIEVHDVNHVAGLDRALAAIASSGAQALIVTPDPLFTPNAAKLARFAAARRLPAMYFTRLFVDAGGLMSYGGSLDDAYRRAAAYVDKILKGAAPADLPVEQPARFELVLNLKAAKALGLTISPRLLLRADEVIE